MYGGQIIKKDSSEEPQGIQADEDLAGLFTYRISVEGEVSKRLSISCRRGMDAVCSQRSHKEMARKPEQCGGWVENVLAMQRTYQQEMRRLFEPLVLGQM